MKFHLSLDIRPRRNRKTSSLRSLVQETVLTPQDFIWPVFIKEGQGQKEPIGAMPGCYRYSIDELLQFLPEVMRLGIPGVALFPVIADSLKDSKASEAMNKQGLIPRVIQEIKSKFPELCLITDVAMDPYSSEGHDGLVKNGEISNDETLEVLARMALVQAEAGADLVAPSDMMDGRVGFIRQALDENGYTSVGILSYAAKYASAFYGPFREALDSQPRMGDKKTYQMDPANAKEALREVELDIVEGADIVMVKPALSYLDVISRVKEISPIPVAAYNVSGEYAMLKAAAEKGWINEKDAILETLLSIKRAGADMIFTYHAVEAAQWISDEAKQVAQEQRGEAAR